jgi:hypothetical protein
MDAWLKNARDATGADDDAATLLDLARIAAHDSGERTNAPLLCYLVGRAQNGASLHDLADAIRRTS